MPFLAIYRSQLLLLIFQEAKSCQRMNLRNKKWFIIILKGFMKQPVIKQGSAFLSLSHWLLHKCFFSLSLSKYSLIFKNWENFIGKLSLYKKNWENFKILTEIFCQKLLVSSVILTFLNHLKPKRLFFDQLWWTT